MSVRSPRVLQLFILVWTDSHIVLIAHDGAEFAIHVWNRTDIDVIG